MRVNLPTPRTPAEVQLDIVAIGGIIEWKPLCAPFRGDFEDAAEGEPLISDDMWAWWESNDDCPLYQAGWSEERKRWEACAYLGGW